MEFSIDNKIIGLPVNQNQQEFVMGVFKIGQILTFTKYTTRVINDFDEDGIPVYNKEIQREVENPRVEKIADFLINDPEATFPTNLVLHIPEEIILKQHKHNNIIEIFIDDKVFFEVKKEKATPSSGDIYISIIDGQHRVRGIEVAIKRLNSDIDALQKTLLGNPSNIEIQNKLDFFHNRLTDLLNIELVVSFFIAKPIEYQAMIFSTINRTQKRVSESLVYSLFGLTLEDSPQKTALQIVLTLNAHTKSPFFNRVKLYGGDYDRNLTPPLSQATMVKSIVSLISENIREAETDRYKKRKALEKRVTPSNKFLPFRKYYAANNDKAMSDIFFYFFTAVKNVFLNDEGKSFWEFNPDTMKPTNVLHTSVGYFALLNILIDMLSEMKESDLFNVSSYEKYLLKAKGINVEDLGRYPLTSKSRSILYLDISLKIWPAKDNSDSRIIRLNESK